ncbi:MAG: hypothetical protein QF815_03940 [Candidatus Peribacteraceae bacterium]|nr:hypothetical protein [Candidatus Peribacteraceae bacterium]MDP7477221.1 hypothetical protein [Candidatus Peribacteraceae bacterium]
MSPAMQERLIAERSTEKYRESHASAIEACLLCYGSKFTELQKIETAIEKMREKTRKMMRGRKRKELARQGKRERQEYWNVNAVPLVNELESRLNILQQQLVDTDALYPDIATEGYGLLMNIIQMTPETKGVPMQSVIYPIVEAWKNLRNRLKEAIDAGGNLLAQIDQDISSVRNALSAITAPTNV